MEQMAGPSIRRWGAGRRTRTAAGALLVLALCSPLVYGQVQRAMAVQSAQEHLFAGIQRLNMGDATGAEAAWRAALRSEPRYGSAHRALGALYLSQGRLEEARQVLRQLASIAPREPHVLCELAEAGYLRGGPARVRLAAEDAELAVQLEPDCFRARTVAGNAWQELGDHRRGLAHLRAAVQLRPADVALAQQLVRGLLDGQQREEAAATARRLTEQYPGYAHGHALLAACYQLFPPGSPEQQALRPAAARALALDPTSALAHAVLGQALLNEGDASRAARHLEAARLLNPGRTATLFALARAYQLLGRAQLSEQLRTEFARRSMLENEVAALEKRLVLEPANARLRRRLQELARKLGEPERAARFAPDSAPSPQARPGASP